MALVEDLRDEAHVLVDQDLRAVADRDAGRLLAAVLEGVEPEVGELRDLCRIGPRPVAGPDAEDTTGVLGSPVLRVEVESEPSVATGHAASLRGLAGACLATARAGSVSGGEPRRAARPRRRASAPRPPSSAQRYASSRTLSSTLDPGPRRQHDAGRRAPTTAPVPRKAASPRDCAGPSHRRAYAATRTRRSCANVAARPNVRGSHMPRSSHDQRRCVDRTDSDR